MPGERAEDAPRLVVPACAARAARLARRLWRTDGWATRIARGVQPPGAAQFGPQLIARWATPSQAEALGLAVARRFTLGSAPPVERELTISPYAPPLRQISAARQGAAAWGDGATSDSAAALVRDMAGMNWGQPPEP